MADESNRDEESWHLGPDPTELQHRLAERDAQTSPIELAREHSYQRLDRPLYILTVERVALFAIAGWALLTRLISLGMRPLSPSEASHALLDLRVADMGRDALSN